MTAFVPESIRIIGTDGGGLSVVLCSMYVDTLADLPTPTAYTGFRLSMGCTAIVINDNSIHRINSAGQWVDITENDGKYTLPPATSNSLGGIMVGSGLTIDSAGMLSGDFSALWDSIYQAEKHLTGVPPLSFMASGNGIEAAVIYGNGQQTGTPKPDAPIMPTFCGVRTGNLYDISSVIYGAWTNGSGVIQSYGYGARSVDIPSSQITVSFNGLVFPYSYSIVWVDSNGGFITRSHIGSSTQIIEPQTFTPPSNAAKFYIQLSNGTDSTNPITEEQIEGYKLMLNLGSTALPYEPYGYKIPITCAGQTVPVYLGQTQTVRRIKKRVFYGTESWSRSSSNGTLYTSSTDHLKAQDITCLCSHYKAQTNALGTGEVNNLRACFSYDSNNLYIRDTSFTSAGDFKAYLAAQYAAGTPVCVWYVLAEPTTGIVNEPLCKIGDYADELSSTDAGVTIPTAKGSNTLTVDTPLQPSKISITYF